MAAFVMAALLSLSMIGQPRIAMDCTIRWVRLTSIVVTFYFGLFMPASRQQLNRMLITYGISGLLAVAIGILLYALQIEIRANQQKLWLGSTFQVRAGGLIGNSGAFGHLTATWCVTCVGALCIVSRSRYRFVLAAAVLMIAAYTVYIASSRATMFHLVTALTAFALLLKTPLAWRKQVLTFALVAGLALTLLVCVSQVLSRPSDRASNVVTTNLERFIPGLNGVGINEFTSNRFDNWPEYIAMMSKNWLLGTGYKTGVRMHEASPDNSYLSVMLETGVLGFTCLSVFVVSVLCRLVTLYLAGDPYAAVMIPVCVGQLTHGLTSDIYTFWITMPVVYLLLGFVIQRKPEPRVK
ncbi:MAG: O-antigen ligase family protein [Planctomycetota bacterium]|nr:O-antigen ligase family protein [Planctomycetota bacterium]